MTHARKISMEIFQLSEYLRYIFVRKYLTNIQAYFPENPRKSTKPKLCVIIEATHVRTYLECVVSEEISHSFRKPSLALKPALITTSEEVDHNILSVSFSYRARVAKLVHFVTHARLRLFFFLYLQRSFPGRSTTVFKCFSERDEIVCQVYHHFKLCG